MAREEPFSTKFNVWWVLSAALVALVLVGGIALGFFAGRSNGEKTGEQEPAPSQSDTTATSPTGGPCGVPADDQDYPVEAPETKWELYSNVVTVPTSNTYGPTKREGDFWQCYAHSPKGALFAAFNLSQAFTTGGVYEAAVDSPMAKELYESESQADSSQTTFPEVAGFSIDSYSDSKATISLLFKSADVDANATIELVWDETADDWRWDAENSPEPGPVEDTSKYTAWSPRNG